MMIAVDGGDRDVKGSQFTRHRHEKVPQFWGERKQSHAAKITETSKLWFCYVEMWETERKGPERVG